MFDHFAGLALKGLKGTKKTSIISVISLPCFHLANFYQRQLFLPLHLSLTLNLFLVDLYLCHMTQILDLGLVIYQNYCENFVLAE